MNTRARWIVGGVVLALLVVARVVVFGRSGAQTSTPPQDSVPASAVTGNDAGSIPLAPPRRQRIATTGISSDGGSGPSGAKDPTVFAEMKWGSGPNQLGHDRPQEGNPEGPMSLTVDATGRMTVVDQVNGRLLHLDARGNPTGTTPLPVQAAQDVAVTADGKSVVLDRLADRTVAIMGPDGKVLGELPVEGKNIDEGGGVTGLFVDGDDVYLEREHGSLVRVGDTNGKPDPERPEIPGRPSRDGKLFLNAGLGDVSQGLVYVTAIAREGQRHLYTREYRLSVPLVGILTLDTDQRGTIYLALLAETPSANEGSEPGQEIRLLCLNPTDGAVLGQTELPATSEPEESFRDFAVLNEGGVLYAYRTAEGVVFQRADCRP